VTHPEIIRYFMTIPEAARLVLQAAATGETGQVLVLDMGEPVRIVDLARQLIRLAGHTEDEIGIEFSGLRPGEKLYEELLADNETTVSTAVPRLRVARLADEPQAAAEVQALLAWAEDPRPREDAEVKAWLARVVVESRLQTGMQTDIQTDLQTDRPIA
jgi:FlaA1/EpsC-like NDP-sugar epimerase